MPRSLPKKAVEIKISTVVAVSVILHDAEPENLEAAMQAMTGGQPDYFDGEFAVIDVGMLDISDRSLDWAALVSLFRRHNLNPVAVRNAPEEAVPGIRAHGLSLDEAVRPREEPQPAEPVFEDRAPAAVAEAPASSVSMIVDTPVRAGQRVYARGGDLIVTAVVNAGAEVIADGSIHIYAPLRGRALAGANGNAQARIFAASMEPELVSIAGIYKTFEGGFAKGAAQRPAQAKLAGDRLEILPLDPNTR